MFFSDQDRLHVIRQCFAMDNKFIFESENIEWLIKQATEVEQLKKKTFNLYDEIEEYQRDYINKRDEFNRYEQALKKVQQQLCKSVKPHLILEDINKFLQSEFLKRNEDN